MRKFHQSILVENGILLGLGVYRIIYGEVVDLNKIDNDHVHHDGMYQQLRNENFYM